MLAAPVALSKLTQLESALNSAIRGKPEVIRLSIACLLARGHLLIEDVPGVGKTTLAHALARHWGRATLPACADEHVLASVRGQLTYAAAGWQRGQSSNPAA